MKTASSPVRLLLEGAELEVPLDRGQTLVLNCAKQLAAGAVDQGRLDAVDEPRTSSEAEFAPGLVANTPLGSLRGFRSLTTFRAHFHPLLQALMLDRRITVEQRIRCVTRSAESVTFFVCGRTSQVDVQSDGSTCVRGNAQPGEKLQTCMVEVTPRVEPGELLRIDVRQEFREGVLVPSGTYYLPLPVPAYALRLDLTPPARNSKLSSGQVVVRGGQVFMLEGFVETVREARLSEVPGFSRIPRSPRAVSNFGAHAVRHEVLVLLRATVLGASPALPVDDAKM